MKSKRLLIPMTLLVLTLVACRSHQEAATAASHASHSLSHSHIASDSLTFSSASHAITSSLATIDSITLIRAPDSSVIAHIYNYRHATGSRAHSRASADAYTSTRDTLAIAQARADTLSTSSIKAPPLSTSSRTHKLPLILLFLLAGAILLYYLTHH